MTIQERRAYQSERGKKKRERRRTQIPFEEQSFYYCQNRSCELPERRYPKGEGIIHDYNGTLLHFCSNSCKNEFIERNV